MYLLAVVYLASILAGFALANVPTSALITPEIAGFLEVVGGLAMVVFALALLVHGVRVLFKRS